MYKFVNAPLISLLPYFQLSSCLHFLCIGFAASLVLFILQTIWPQCALIYEREAVVAWIPLALMTPLLVARDIAASFSSSLTSCPRCLAVSSSMVLTIMSLVSRVKSSTSAEVKFLVWIGGRTRVTLASSSETVIHNLETYP